MCRFKSGIILKNHCVVVEDLNDSHSDLLEKLGIEDTIANAMTKFVRAELLPPVNEENNEEWWAAPETWEINVDQDILPDWYEEDPEKYNEEFRSAVKDWWSKHVRVGQEIEELSEGFCLLKDCKVEKLCKQAEAILCDSVVEEMYDNSIVKYMCGNSVVKRMFDNSIVKQMRDSSIVRYMYFNSTVEIMLNDSAVEMMSDDAMIRTMADKSVIHKMYSDSIVKCQTAHCGRRKLHFDFGASASPTAQSCG